MIRVLLLVIGYCLGMIQTGYLYGRMKGIDTARREVETPVRQFTSSTWQKGWSYRLCCRFVQMFYSMFDRKGMGCFKRTAAYGRYLYAVSGVWCYFGTQLSMLFKF